MKIIANSICKIGGRNYNQDFVAVSVNGTNACFVACDGLGSYVGSEVASMLCATKIIEVYNQISDIDPSRAATPEFLQTYIQNAHNYVVSYKESTPALRSSCTTVAAVVTDCNTTTIAHIGDTRVYYFKDKKLFFQTRDHSLARVAVDMGEIDLDAIRTHKDQNKLTRVLGSDYYVAPDTEIDVTPLKPGDAFLLCTDGFWEYVYDEEAEEDLMSSTTPIEWLSKMEKRLLARVGKNNDNYSAIVAMVVE